jgi:DNA-binding GntR family transcriptional regulator
VAGDDKQAVLASIRVAILEGRFAPRQRLIESDLCESYGASRFSVRTALHELAAQGLVEFQPNRGARVREVSLAEAIEITEVRKVLEGLEAARAAQRATKAEASELRQIGREMRSAVRRGELVHYSELNVRLHALIRQMGAHETAARLLMLLRDQTVRHQFSLSLMPGRPSVSLPQHEAIIDAIVARRPAEAEGAMHAHLQSVIEALRALPVAVSR